MVEGKAPVADAHFVYYARGLFFEPAPGVKTAPPLEEGLSNPVRVAALGDEQRHHGPIAMLGGKWFRDITPAARLFFDPKDAAQRAEHNNRATALHFTLATGEHVTKLVFGHAKPDSRHGAYLVYTVITRSAERATTMAAEPEHLVPLLLKTLGDAAAEWDLKGLKLVRPLHHAHPSDLASDPMLQRAFRQPRADFVRHLETSQRTILGLQQAMRAQLALLEQSKATQQKQATSAFEERRTLAQLSSEVEVEREALARERADTEDALRNLDSRDAEERDAARRQLGNEIERAREEREAARKELLAEREQVEKLGQALAALEVAAAQDRAVLAERDAALAEAEDIVQDLYRQIETLSRHRDA